jgi:hypothetical protein
MRVWDAAKRSDPEIETLFQALRLAAKPVKTDDQKQKTAR